MPELSKRDDFKRTLNRLSDYSEASLVRELQRIAAALGRNSLTIRDIDRNGRCSYFIIKKCFGGLHNALKAAGLNYRALNRSVSDEELLAELARVWERVLVEKGRRPHNRDLKAYSSKFSKALYTRRWGSWIKACEALLEWDPHSTRRLVEPSESAKVVQSLQKRPIPLRIRYAILLRDNFVCQVCGRSPALNPGLEMHVDHIVSERDGGTLEPSNLRCLCADCNLGKGPNSERRNSAVSQPRRI